MDPLFPWNFIHLSYHYRCRQEYKIILCKSSRCVCLWTRVYICIMHMCACVYVRALNTTQPAASSFYHPSCSHAAAGPTQFIWKLLPSAGRCISTRTIGWLWRRNLVEYYYCTYTSIYNIYLSDYILLLLLFVLNTVFSGDSIKVRNKICHDKQARWFLKTFFFFLFFARRRRSVPVTCSWSCLGTYCGNKSTDKR